MQLVMFDIDGTLIQSTRIDKSCFADAVSEVLGIDTGNCDWASFSHVTDPGLAMEISMKYLGREISDRELLEINRSFENKLVSAAENRPEDFIPVPGTKEIIKRLTGAVSISGRRSGRTLSAKNRDKSRLQDYRGNSRFVPAVATGGWKGCALIKLRAAGIDLKNIPTSTADDSYKREDIMLHAYSLALKEYNVTSFDSITYVGDAVWDVKASEALGYRFIGIGHGWKADKLLRRGATRILADFSDQEKFFRFLSRSRR